jgi:hypothetical protein
MTIADTILNYLFSLRPSGTVKEGVMVINPFSEETTRATARLFYKKFYNDKRPRTALIGINPGRFGGAITGVPFTDPVALREYCGIDNDLGNTRELSSRFVYELIGNMGGADKFYRRYFFGTMYPLALVKENKNYNYYDSCEIIDHLMKDIILNLETQVSFGLNRDKAICLGKKNFELLTLINRKYKFFKSIEWVEHPRYIQQYKLKHANEYILKYKALLGE